MRRLFNQDWRYFQHVAFWLLLNMFLVLTYHWQWQNPARRALESISRPVLGALALPGEMWDWILDSWAAHDLLALENQRLRLQSVLLNARVQQLQALLSEYEALKRLVHAFNSEVSKVHIAHVLGVVPGLEQQKLIIDKGSKEGVVLGTPVLDEGGVFGQVTRVYPQTSEISVVTSIAVPAVLSRNGLRFIASGRGRMGWLEGLYLAQHSDIQVGDEVRTSGLDSLFPSGFLLGKVLSIRMEPGANFLHVNILPSAHLDRSRFLLLLDDKALKNMRLLR